MGSVLSFKCVFYHHNDCNVWMHGGYVCIHQFLHPLIIQLTMPLSQGLYRKQSIPSSTSPALRQHGVTLCQWNGAGTNDGHSPPLPSGTCPAYVFCLRKLVCNLWPNLSGIFSFKSLGGISMIMSCTLCRRQHFYSSTSNPWTHVQGSQ